MRSASLLACLFGLIALMIAAPLGFAADLTVSQPGLFSYQVPGEWTIKSSPTVSKYPVAMAPAHDNFACNINVQTENTSVDLASYVEAGEKSLANIPQIKKFQILDKRPFQTTGGLGGVRVVLTCTVESGGDLIKVWQIQYIFAGHSDTKITVTATAQPSDSDQMAPIFDAALRTFSLQ